MLTVMFLLLLLPYTYTPLPIFIYCIVQGSANLSLFLTTINLVSDLHFLYNVSEIF